ncbi:sigma-54 interaction domain-containing protein [Virgibacillus kimchii]
MKGSMSELRLKDTPFFSIILNNENRIIGYNHLLQSILKKDETGKKIASVFAVWKESSCGKLIHAEYKDHSFIFISGKEQGDEHKELHGIESAMLGVLLNENEKLKTLNRELDTIIENSYDGIYITDRNGVTLKTNSAIERITGIPKEYYVGKNVSALIKRGILKSSVTKKVLKHKRMVSVVQKNYRGNETLLTGSPIYNDDGEIDKIVTNIRDLSDLNELQAELAKVNELNKKYKQELERLKNGSNISDDIIAESKEMQVIFDTAARIADIDATVLILGETGVGKDVLANYIFSQSRRSEEGELIKVNCGAIPADLLESELFGYEGGAFTGASKKGKPGMFELANNGILFMDEIGELSLSLQVKLLRVLQEKEIQRVGGTRRKKVNVRVIAATNRNLQKMVEKGEFREDLYYRINVIPIHIPPLRDRRSDIIPLMNSFLLKFNEKYNLNKSFDEDLRSFFFSHSWTGNIRELSNLIERLIVTARQNVVSVSDLPPEYQQNGAEAESSIGTLKETVEMAEKRILSLAANKFNNTYEIAEALKSSQPTIVRKLKKYNIDIGG